MRLSPQGYSVSAGSLHGGKWQTWPAANGTSAPTVEQLLEALSFDADLQCPQLDVVLDSAMSRTQIVQFPAGVRKPEERQAFLKAAFRNVFGAEAAEWHIVAETAYANEAVPAVAIDAGLMQAVGKLCERHTMQLRSLRTSFVDCFNRLRSQLSGHVGAFALIEQERVSIGLWRRRGWVAISTLAMAAEDGAGIAALHAQMLARSDEPLHDGTLYVAGSKKSFAVPLSEGWTLQWLTADTR
ncbi:hypothetical protein GCM10025770_16100 [Viridibacterium curvum]|uniref:Uncharacterized protein n=1 Tax=Viridibacterium curvum TaxID=1101404 RepID=A0ABP9QKQ6_9RHOO